MIKQHIPNLITLLNLFLGCVAVIFAFSGRMEYVPYLVLGAAAADFADGLSARLLRVSSPLGVQLDSLADMVTFGLVPGVMMFQLLQIAWGGDVSLTKTLPAFMLTLFSALRLAKFNIDTRQTEGFLGLPTPANTVFITSLGLILHHDNYGLTSLLVSPWFLYLVTVVFSLLMVVELPLLSNKFKHFHWKGNEQRFILIGGALLLIALLGYTGIALAVVWYLLFSAFVWLSSGRA